LSAGDSTASCTHPFAAIAFPIGLPSSTFCITLGVVSHTMSSRTGSWISTICHGRPVLKSLAAPSITPSSDATLCGSLVPHP
jgi:hypothetical protein